MKTTITGRHFDISDPIRAYAEEKIEKLEKFYNGIHEVDCVLKGEDRTFHCELIIHIKNHPSIVIDVSHDSMYAAIDLAMDKAQRQLRRQKEKVRDHRPEKNAPPPGPAAE